VYNVPVRTLRRLARDDGGQALAEYGIILALMGGAGWLQNAAQRIAADPKEIVIGAAALVLVLAWMTRRPT